MLERNAARGMLGCIGSLDCSHWEWAAFPKGLTGQYQNRKKRRSIVMETVCDEDLYIWHFFIGAPGSLNDLNVLRISRLYFDVVEGAWPPKSFSICDNVRSRRLLYYLTDGVYPKYPIFVSPYPNPITPAEKSFNRLQEALRKDVERLHGVLTARFHIFLHPGRFGSVEQMTTPCPTGNISWISSHFEKRQSDTHRRNIRVCRLQVDPPYSGRGGPPVVRDPGKKPDQVALWLAHNAPHFAVIPPVIGPLNPLTLLLIVVDLNGIF